MNSACNTQYNSKAMPTWYMNIDSKPCTNVCYVFMFHRQIRRDPHEVKTITIFFFNQIHYIQRMQW